jgi:hypothetical protein
MLRFLLGVGVGAALIYYLDTERGAERRAQVNGWARQYVNSDTIEQARQTTMNQARALGEQVKQGANQVTDRVSQYRSSRRNTNASSEGQLAGVDSLNGATVGVEQP